MRLIGVLGYAGLLPFVFFVVSAFFKTAWLYLNPFFAFVSYSAVILGFLGGVIWGRQLGTSDTASSAPALIFSNLFALVACLALLISSFGLSLIGLSLIVLSLAYVALLIAERDLLFEQRQDYPASYPTMRYWLTGAVVGLHLVMLWLYYN
ncbi:DUF3429 domain-containing protein [Aestuariirhabdus sp. Z084]|uniref:DUF3429 domain-containing protein n=1 Tax=Aestuariirhabdus haliotis TaxID=2918751 RepID=UPI00201B41ED|nr:DUF3429 domain-containing protein [Aestuariirhabdus haliotis]MCL6416049.1 DUF3429 domain-containing protein [Aestuariirhabdus haliotis]MCL6419383.1 DUF3429 domain-containing protein [Aestuariirhabdus haliotis]